MALPKRRLSKTRGRKRRTHDKLSSPAISKCPNCGQPAQPHRLCPHCGQYRGRDVIIVDEV
jgi:large subunit ribosomal protein L32